MRALRTNKQIKFHSRIIGFVKLSLVGMVGLLLLVAGLQAVLFYAQGGRMLSIQTKSMVPYLQKGDLVEVVATPKEKLKVGDVITYVSPVDNRITLTHRIIALPSDSNHHKFITKGDANPVPDAPVDAMLIIGKMQFHTRYIGFGIDWLHTILGIAIIIYIPALAIIWSELKRLIEYFKSVAPYVEASYAACFKKVPRRMQLHHAGLLLLVTGAITMLTVLPAYAAMQGKVTLTGTSITTISLPHPPPEPTKLLVWSLYMRCSYQNTATTATAARVTIYNPTNTRVDLFGWKIASQVGADVVVTSSTTVYERRYAVIDILIGGTGLSYSGDFLQLIAPNGTVIDALSWGSDTSAFSPSLPALNPESKLDRVPRSIDTDSLSDWQITSAACLRQ